MNPREEVILMLDVFLSSLIYPGYIHGLTLMAVFTSDLLICYVM